MTGDAPLQNVSRRGVKALEIDTKSGEELRGGRSRWRSALTQRVTSKEGGASSAAEDTRLAEKNEQPQHCRDKTGAVFPVPTPTYLQAARRIVTVLKGDASGSRYRGSCPPPV